MNQQNLQYMKRHTPAGLISGLLAAQLMVLAATGAPVIVNSTEEWDGLSNPHAADGVTLSGSGTDTDPWVYTIPNGMRITSTGTVKLWSAANQDQAIKFEILGGDLEMEPGAVLNIERYRVRESWTPFILDLGGNSITGAGRIGSITDRNSTPRDLTIQNVQNVSLAEIDMHVENANTGPLDFRNIVITASGSVVVTGTIDNSDRDSGGDGCGEITIKASSIDVNNIDARGFRNDPSGRAPYSGNVNLIALAPAGNYNPNDSVNNTAANQLTVRGVIRTMAVDPRTIFGNVTLQAVAQQLVFGTIEVPPDAIKTLEVGVVRGGASASDLFINYSNSPEAAANVVQWAGNFTLPAGSAPAFSSDLVVRADARGAEPYAQSLSGSASDPDPGTTLSYGRSVLGPAWLRIAADGTLSGTPGLTDSGTNTWQIWVSDGTRFDTATLQIFVATPPRWNDGDANFAFDNATQDVPYADTLADMVLYFGSSPLTFGKSSGPSWLSIAADGTLSGTPDATNVLNNVFNITVSDGTTNVPATLNIFVNGSPKFNLDPFIRATAFVGQDYGVRSQTLAGAAIDPQDPASSLSLTWAKISGPAWLTVDPSGALGGTPGAANLGVNTFTISAANAFPATTATLRINVAADAGAAPIEVVTREYWDGISNPHAAEGVTLTGSGTAEDPATYTIPRGLNIYGSGQIYTSQPTGPGSEQGALHLKFDILGDLNMDAENNAFVTAVHNRNNPYAQRHLILDLYGTNSILGQGRIVGLGNQVNPAVFPDCYNDDTPRILTITNVHNVSLYDVNVQVRNANNWGRPLLIQANGKVQVTNGIDNSDRDGGGDGGNDVTVIARAIEVNGVDTRSFRTSSFRNVGNITLRALAPPDFSPSNGGANGVTNALTVNGNLRPTTPQADTTWGTITAESVVLTLNTNAQLNSPAPGKTTLNVGKLQNGAAAADLFKNASAGAYTPNFVVDWSGNFVPQNPALVLGPSAPGQIVLSWSGSGFVLETNANLLVPGGWGIAPSGTSNPATNTIGAGNLFFRLKSL